MLMNHACRLRDDDDDIRGVAASMLIPVADEIVQHLPDVLPHVLHQLGDCLEYARDDLSSSVGSVMDLLSKLCQSDSVISLFGKPGSRSFPQLVPLIYPFFRHTITSVRAAAVRAIQTFVGMRERVESWADERIFRLLFQNMVVEEKIDIPDGRKDDFRHELMNYVASVHLEGEMFDYRENERLCKALELKVFEDRRD